MVSFSLENKQPATSITANTSKLSGHLRNGPAIPHASGFLRRHGGRAGALSLGETVERMAMIIPDMVSW